MVVLTEQQKIEKAAQTTRVAFAAVAEERVHSDKKTARLRAMRLEREAQQSATAGEMPKPKIRRRSKG